MAGLFPNPFPQYVDSAGLPVSGGTLNFYETGTSTPLAVYSDQTLSTSLGTSVTLNSAGRPSTQIFLQNGPAYKVILRDSAAAEIWTAPYVSATDILSVTLRKVGSGSPNGVVAGTAGSAGVLPTEYWDYTNYILYECTTTGSASSASAAVTTATWPAVKLRKRIPVVPG